MNRIEKLSVQQVADVLGISPTLVHRGIQSKELPFGICIKATNEQERNKYIIPKEWFEKWLKGEQICGEK